MQAVNLIPAEERRKAGGASGRSNGGAYLVLAALTLAVLVVGVHALLASRAADADAEATTLNAQADSLEGQSAARQSAEPTVSYATLRVKRTEAISSLVRSRVDWPVKLHQLAQALPADVTLQQLTASTSAGTTSSNGSSSLRSSLDVPAFELTGCAVDQDEVARTLTDLQSLSGVSRVALASSQAADDDPSSRTGAGSSSDGSGGGSSSCGSRPTFSAVVFFTAPAGSTTTPAP